jgi:hypothetical protein
VFVQQETRFRRRGPLKKYSFLFQYIVIYKQETELVERRGLGNGEGGNPEKAGLSAGIRSAERLPLILQLIMPTSVERNQLVRAGVKVKVLEE